MSRTCGRVTRNTAACLADVFCILVLLAILPEHAQTKELSSRQTQTRQTQDTGNPLIQLGRFPPDFELPKLTLTTDVTGKPIGVINEKDTISLSSFRGKKPVCLIMSSYT